MPDQPPRICALGSFNLDLVVRAPRFPRPGETLLGGPFDTFAGGKGANQAIAAARLGADVTFLGCVGDDEGAALAARVFGDEGVGIDALDVRPDVRTGVGVITVADSGDNHIVVAPGANHTFDAEWIDARADAIRDADALLLQLEVPFEANVRAVEIARETGTRVVLNAAPYSPLPDAFLSKLDALVVNQVEYEDLGRPSVPLVIVTLGREGAVAWEAAAGGPPTETRRPSHPIEPVDTTAAGDAFCAAATVALLERGDVESALEWGTAAGALACTVAGAVPSLPERAEVERLVEE